MNQAHARIEFAQWLKETNPALFNRAVQIAEQGNGLGDTEKTSFWSRFSTAAMGLGTTYLALKNQRDAMKINLTRAQQGQPPIDIATTAPVVRTQVDLSPELQRNLISNAGEGLSRTALYAGVAFVAYLAFKKFA